MAKKAAPPKGGKGGMKGDKKGGKKC